MARSADEPETESTPRAMLDQNDLASLSSLGFHNATTFPPMAHGGYGTKTATGNLRIFNCKHCQRAFTREEHLTRHILLTHNKLKPYICGICLRPFSRRDLLLRHAKTSTRVRRWRFCGSASRARRRPRRMTIRTKTISG